MGPEHKAILLPGPVRYAPEEKKVLHPWARVVI